LDKPDLMQGARLVRNPLTGAERYEREETHAEVLLSRRAKLEALALDRERSAGRYWTMETPKARSSSCATPALRRRRSAIASEWRS